MLVGLADRHSAGCRGAYLWQGKRHTVDGYLAAIGNGRAGRGYEEMQQMYTAGQCWHFARVLNRRYQWPLAALHSQSEQPLYLHHAVVCRPDGLIVDFEGAHRVRDLQEEWDLDYLVHVGPEQFGAVPRNCCRYSEERARRWIIEHEDFYTRGRV